jgi:hypothetical protein
MLPSIGTWPTSTIRSLRRAILEHGVHSIDLVLHLEVVRVGRSPVEIQSRSNFSVFHLNLPSRYRCAQTRASPRWCSLRIRHSWRTIPVIDRGHLQPQRRSGWRAWRGTPRESRDRLLLRRCLGNSRRRERIAKALFRASLNRAVAYPGQTFRNAHCTIVRTNWRRAQFPTQDGFPFLRSQRTATASLRSSACRTNAKCRLGPEMSAGGVKPDISRTSRNRRD